MRNIVLFWGVAIAVLFSVILSFSSGISSDFYLDDRLNLEPLRVLEDSPELFEEVVTENRSGLLGRYVSMGSFAIDVRLWGYSAITFKLINLAFHLLNSVLVFFLARRVFSLLLNNGLENDSRRAYWLGLSVTALWAISPMMVSTVLYPVQRMTILSATFCFSGMLLYLESRLRQLTHTRMAWVGLLSAIVFFLPLAALSKENGLLLPLYLLLIECTLFRFKCNHKLSWSIVAYFVVLLLVPVIILVVIYPKFLVSLVSYTNRDFNAYERLLSESRILFLYVKALVFPSSGDFGLFHDDIVISRNITSPISTLYSLVSWGVVLILSIISIFKNKLPLVGFGALLYMMGHLMESTVLGLELYFEHRNYLPSLGIYISAVGGLWYFFDLMRHTRYVWLLFIGMFFLFSIVTWQRAIVWSDPKIRVIMNAENHPTSPRSLLALAGYYANEGFLDASNKVLDKVLELNPKMEAGITLQRVYGTCLNRFPIPDDVFVRFETGATLAYPEYISNMLNEINTAIRNDRCYIKDKQRLVETLSNWIQKQVIFSWATETRLAETFLNLGYIEFAKLHLSRIWQAYRDSNEAPLLLIELYLMTGEIENARQVLRELDVKERKYKISEKSRITDIRNYLDAN